jgi:guanylate kinase
VFDHFYGTSRKFVNAQEEKGRHVILVIDTQGALQLRKKLDAIFIFISPPSLEELRARLYRRKSETDQAIEHRLSWAEREIALAQKYDYHIVNDHLKTAYDALRSILIAEEHKNR